MTDQPQYPVYPGSEGSGGPTPPPPYGQEPPSYGQSPPSYGSVPPPPGGQAPPPPGGGYPPPPGGYQPSPGGYGPAPTNNQKALWSLILGILSVTCCGIFTGVAAIVLGSMAKKEILATGGREGGGGMATAGFVLGLVSIGLTVLVALLFLVGLSADA